MTINDIKSGLTHSCLLQEPELFLPFLQSPKVITDFPDKLGFFSFYESILNDAKNKKLGSLKLIIKKEVLIEDKLCDDYSFYDEFHKHPLITIFIIEKEDEIFMEIAPF